jgi:hypothetical protein
MEKNQQKKIGMFPTSGQQCQKWQRIAKTEALQELFDCLLSET